MKRETCPMSLALLALPFLLAACAPAPLKVALLTKLDSGSNVGSSEVNAARLYFTDGAGKAGGAIEIVPFDDGWDPAKTVVAYEAARAAGIDVFITSHVSACAVAIKDAVARDGAFMLVTGAATPLLTGHDDLIFRNVSDTDSEQDEVAKWISSKGFRDVLVVRDVDNDAYTGPSLRRIQSLYDGNLRVEDVSMAALDPAALRDRIAAKPFDLLYLLIGGYKASAGSIAQIARLVNPSCSILFTPWMKTPTLLDTAGSALVGAFMPAFYPKRGTDRRVDDWVALYAKRHGYSPTFISLNVYQAVEMIDGAARKGARTPEALARQFRGATVETSFGPIGFDEHGDSVRPIHFIDDIAGEFSR